MGPIKHPPNRTDHSQVGCSGVMPALVDEVGGGSGLGERDHLRGGVAARVHAGASP